MLARVKRAAKKRERSETDWREAIRAAVDEGASLRSVAAAAGVSHVRVLQITRGE
jgi:transposase-like protein